MLPLCVITCDARVGAMNCTVSPFKCPTCFVSQAAAILSNTFAISQDRVNQIHQLSIHVHRERHVNKVVLWPGCGDRARCRFHKKNVQSVRFVVKRKGCCCNLSVGVALIVWFTTNGMLVKNNNMGHSMPNEQIKKKNCTNCFAFL